MRILFETFRSHLNQFFDTVDAEKLSKVFEALLSCEGLIVISGVGKSGLIAQKIAATFVSTGTRTVFLDPTDALHGGIGILSSRDVFLALSKSGESEELLELIPFVRKKGAKIIAVVSDPTSRLAKASDLIAHLPVMKELCPFDLAPTTSTTIQLIFGDILAIALMKAKQFAASDFAMNHPAGFLGKKSTLKVADLMVKGNDLPLCRGKDLLIDVLHELTSKRSGCILVVDETSSLEGIFTDGDLRRAIFLKKEKALQMSMHSLMTKSPRTTSPQQLAIAALRKMEEEGPVTVLPVIDKKQVTGLLRMHDILQSGLK